MNSATKQQNASRMRTSWNSDMYKSNNMVCEPVKKSASAMHVYLLNNRYLPPWKYHCLLVNRPEPPETASRDSKGELRDRPPIRPKKAVRPRGPQWATRLHVPQVIWVFRGWRTENTGSFAVPLYHAMHICSPCTCVPSTSGMTWSHVYHHIHQKHARHRERK